MKIIRLIILFIPIQLISQNLINNPSFELTTRNTDSISSFDSNVKFWSTPNFGTTDLFDLNSSNEQINVPNNYFGKQNVKFGNKYAGFYLYSYDNYREYIQGYFKQPLKKGQNYKVSFYISLAESSKYAIKKIGFILSNPRIMTSNWNELSEKKLKNLWLPNSSKYTIENKGYYNNSEDWILISKNIIAKGGENFIVIGNFDKNIKTKKKKVNKKAVYGTSYYYIDMVSVEIIEDFPYQKFEKDSLIVQTKIKIPKSNKIEINKKYTLQNINFNFNSIELSETAKNEVKIIYEYLKLNENTKIKIIGHSDNFGNESYNKTLSENRAKAIENYLMELGINKKRIESLGYGSLNPISTNKTKEGRNKNRRVEFKITKHNTVYN